MAETVEEFLQKRRTNRRGFLKGAIGTVGVAGLMVAGAVIGNKLGEASKTTENPPVPYYPAADLREKLAGRKPLEPDSEKEVTEVMIKRLGPTEADRRYESVAFLHEAPLFHLGTVKTSQIGPLPEGSIFPALRITGGEKYPGLREGAWYEIDGKAVQEKCPELADVDPKRAYFVSAIFAEKP